MPIISDPAKILPRGFAFLILIMLLSAYSNTLHSPAVLDDFHSFVQDPTIVKGSHSAGDLLALGNTKFGLSRWIPMITLSWDSTIGGGEIAYFHITNIIIHILCFLAVYFLLSRLFAHLQKNNSDHSDRLPILPDAALWVAALWALNPVQTSAVTYIVQRMASLVTLFSVLTVAFYISGRMATLDKKPVRTRSMTYFALSGMSMVLALFCKENAAIVPFILLVTEAWFFTPDLFRSILSLARKRWILSATTVLLVLSVFVSMWPGIVAGYGGRHFTLEERLMTEARIVVWYLSVILWPNPNRLSLEHDVELSTSLLAPPTTLLSIAVIVLLLCGAVFWRKKYPLLSYGIMWFFLGLVIESTIIPLELIFDHRMYFASIGLTLSVVVAVYGLFFSMLLRSRMTNVDHRKLCWSLFAIVASILSLATFTRNADWKDSVTLNGDNVLKAPKNHRAHVNYAVALSQAGRYLEAIDEANIAISLGKPNFDSYSEAADVIVLSYFGLNQFEEAAREGERLLRVRPEYAGSSALAFTYLSLAYSYTELGRLQEAYACILKGLRTNQQLTLPIAHLKNTAVNLLSILLEKARLSGSDLNGDGTVDPGYLSHSVWIAQTFLKLGDRLEAREILQEAANRNVDDKEALQLLDSIIRDDLKNAIQQAKGSYKERYVYHPFSQFNASMALAFLIREQKSLHRFLNLGERLVDNAINLRQDSADAHLLKGWYHFGRNEFVEAVGKAKKAIELDPNDAKICLGLGFFLAQAGHPHEAIDALQKALDLYPDHPQRRAVLNVIGNLRSETPKLAKDAAATTN